MKNQLSILFFLTLGVLGFSQNGTVKGTITDNTQSVLSGVNVLIKNSTRGVQTNENGIFEIANIPNGDHTLVVSYLGFKTREFSLTIANNETKELGGIILYEGNEILSEVFLVGEQANKFSRKKTAYVAKLPLKDLENPQVYSTVTSELLESQLVTSFDDALINAAGVNKLWEATGRSGQGTSYYSMRGFSGQSSFIDGLPGFTFSAVDPSYIERIEVLKGPTATLFGSTVPSLGGLINVVTKKPYQGFGGSVTYTGGSFNTHRVSVDINTPLGNSENLYFRLNTSYLTQDSFQDAGFKKTFFIAPSFSYRVNNRLNLSFGIEYSRTKQTNPLMVFLRRGYPMVSNTIEEFGLDNDKSFTNDDIFLTVPTLTTRAIGDYKISDQWTSQTIVATSNTDSDGYYQYMVEGAAVPLLASPDPNTQAFANQLLQQNVLTRVMDKRDEYASTINVQQNFIGDFKIGKIRNRMVLGLDYFTKSSGFRNKFSNPNLPGFPFFDAFFLPNGEVLPTPFTPNSNYRITRAELDPIFDLMPATVIDTKSQTFATYVSDVINFSPNLSAMIGLRLNYFDQDGDENEPLDDYTKTTFSPTAGIVYQPILNKLSLFANYQTGFINVDPNVGTDGTVTTFDPLKSEQFEAGFKTNLFNGKLNAGISYYHIIVNDKDAGDPTDPLLVRRISIDETISQGVEIEVNATPINGLNIRASYSYNESEISNTDFDVLKDTRPEEAGPETLYNFWADYKFQKGTFLENFGIGAGFNGASEYFTLNNNISGQFTLPEYTIVNASVYYDAKKFRIGIKANNLTDEEYYKGWSTINPQASRAFLGTISYKF
ncbi:TonB-dependent receptor [Aquimarina sp. I32.4]|uniref:TonB-dependent receptor n=1 Tax=Aquimarina sp. I32.4 TaxID=2053903 RepID=UPI000CDECFE6|nr:TonB-dependent receptor [Aquimarina sp. I32.4]